MTNATAMTLVLWCISIHKKHLVLPNATTFINIHVTDHNCYSGSTGTHSGEEK